MKNKKTIILVLALLALIPFRLPISVMLINFFTWINVSSSPTGDLPVDLLCVNAVVTKLVYDLILIIRSMILIHKMTIERMEDNFGVLMPTGLLLFIYLIYDGFSTFDIAQFILTNY